MQSVLSVQFGFRQTSPPMASGLVSKHMSSSLHVYPELPPQLSLHWEIFGVGLGVLVGTGVDVGVAVGISVLVGTGVLVGIVVGVLVGAVVHRT